MRFAPTRNRACVAWRADPGGVEHVLENFAQAQRLPEPLGPHMLLVGREVEPAAACVLQLSDDFEHGSFTVLSWLSQ